MSSIPAFQLEDLQRFILEMPDNWDAASLDSLEKKIPDVTDPDSLFQMQKVVLLFLNKMQDCPESASPLSELQFVQLPTELLADILARLPIGDILKMRLVSQWYKECIDEIPELRIKIAHHYLQKCTLPMNDLKFVFESHKLAVEIHGSLSISKLVQPPLCKALHSIDHMILKDGMSQELTQLFTQLQDDNRLMTLYLWNCSLGEETTKALELLLKNPKPPLIYLCSPSPLPPQLSNHVVPVKTENSSEYSLERFIKQSAVIELSEFEQQVQNESFSGELILKKMKEMHPLIRAGLISSIWHSTVMPSNVTAQSSNRDQIQRRVYDYVLEHPHDASVRAAVNTVVMIERIFS
jgi:hypothetical protein